MIKHYNNEVDTEKTFLNKIFSSKSYILKLLSLLLITISFFYLAFSSFTVSKLNIVSGVDDNWRFTIKYLAEQNKFLGKDVFFTYGPASQHILLSPELPNQNIFSILVPYLFLLSVWLIIFCLIYKLTRFKFLSLLFLFPLFVLSHFSPNELSDAAVQIILLLFLFNVNKKNTFLNRKIILFASIFSAIVLLYKFSMGLLCLLTIALIIFFNQGKTFKIKKSIISSCLYLFITFINAYLLFVFLTGELNIFPFLLNSFELSSLFKEYMGISKHSIAGDAEQNNFIYLINLFLLLFLFIPLFILKKRNFIPYLALSYIVILYGWIRYDHVGFANIYIFFLIMLAIIEILKKEAIYSSKEYRLKINWKLLVCTAFLPLAYIYFSNLGVNIFGNTPTSLHLEP